MYLSFCRSGVLGVHVVCVSLIFEVTEWLRWHGGMPFKTFQDGIPPGSSPQAEGTHKNG